MNIKDLARLSGYSLGTVSRVLNHQNNVSQKARDTILSLAEEYGFELNPNAQALKLQHTHSILVEVKGRSNPLFARMVEFIQDTAAKTDYTLLVDYLDENDNEVQRAIRICREKKPEGILFLGGIRSNFSGDFSALSLPSVLVTHTAAGLGFSNLSSVCIEDGKAAESACRELLRQGHQKIAVLGGDLEQSEIARQRFEGCQSAFIAAGVGIAAFVPASFTFEGGYQAMERILDMAPITAVFAMSDAMAIGAMRCIHDRGLTVPGDISVLGFDGLSLGEYTVPSLSTVTQPAQAIAEAAVALLLEQLAGSPGRNLIIPYTLTLRESTRPLSP